MRGATEEECEKKAPKDWPKEDRVKDTRTVRASEGQKLSQSARRTGETMIRVMARIRGQSGAIAMG